MAKAKVQIKRQHDDDSLHIYINRPTDEEGYYIEIPFDLRPVKQSHLLVITQYSNGRVHTAAKLSLFPSQEQH
jgi:hypothetical protein